jgi:hypothetical protein
MELSMVFTGFILSMCALHLVCRASGQIARWWAGSRPDQSILSRKSGKKVIRSDWYVFFYRSDLLGKEPEKNQPEARKSSGNRSIKYDHRPVLRV